MNSKTLTLVDESGAPQALLEDPEGHLKNGLGTYSVVSSMPDLLVLSRHTNGDETQRPGRVLMAGEILSESTILDVVNVVVSARWAGTLHVHGPDSHRALGFDRGALRHATSDHPEDRLDKVLFRIGVLTPAQAETVMRELRPGQRFGEVVVERGLIDRKKLFEYLRKQMEEIFHSAALERRGGYLFQVAADGEPAPAMIAHLPAQQLLFIAAERLDHVKEFQRLIHDDNLRPELEPGVDLTELEPRDRLVLGYCDGKRSVREVASETWLGRYRTLRIIHRFLQQGRLRLVPPVKTTRELAEGIAAPCDWAMREIFKVVERYGKLDQLRRELGEKVEESEYRDDLAGIVGEDGSVDAERVSAWLEGLEIRDREELVKHTLHELISFALFFASLTLPRVEERELSHKVNSRLRESAAEA